MNIDTAYNFIKKRGLQGLTTLLEMKNESWKLEDIAKVFQLSVPEISRLCNVLLIKSYSLSDSARRVLEMHKNGTAHKLEEIEKALAEDTKAKLSFIPGDLYDFGSGREDRRA